MRWPLSILLLVLAGCSNGTDAPPVVELDAGPSGGGSDAASPGSDAGGPAGTCDERRVPLVYYGTREPTAMPLSPGQILAIGHWGGCTGTFITDQWVLTANHCGIRVGARFCVGPDPRNPNVCFTAAQVQSHPSQDMTLVRMDAPASSRIPELVPIAINTTMLDSSWIGRIAEAAGYGQQENGSSGEREFTAEPISGFERTEFLVIDGQGTRGVCFGDSGGPVMILADDGTVRVAGDLSFGDPSCVGQDRYSRTDLAVDWIESFTGPTVGATDCASLGTEGRCVGATATWCEGDEARSERCETCGWDTTANGYRCITGADPCEGLDWAGSCDDTTARWCDRGEVRERDCAACDEGTCGRVDGLVGCVDDPCADVDYLGRCDGDVAVWCHEGTMIRQRDCGAEGLRCAYVNDRIGYFCSR